MNLIKSLIFFAIVMAVSLRIYFMTIHFTHFDDIGVAHTILMKNSIDWNQYRIDIFDVKNIKFHIWEFYIFLMKYSFILHNKIIFFPAEF